MNPEYNENILHMILEANLKSLGSIAVKVIQALNTDSELEEVENLVLKDAALTAKTIKIANAYKTKDDIERKSLRDAIIRIGFDGLKSICICIAIIENIPARHSHQRTMIVDALQRSFETAIHARNLIAKMGDDDPHVGYISGLLRNIGELCFLSSSVPNLPEYRELLADGLTSEQACLTLSGFDYDDLTEQLVESWELPNTINDAMNPAAVTECGKAVQVANDLTLAIRSGRESKAFTQVSRRLVDEYGLGFKDAVTFIKDGFSSARQEFAQYAPNISAPDTGRDQFTYGEVKRKASRPVDASGVRNAIKKLGDLGKTGAQLATGYSVLAEALYNYSAFDRVVISSVDRSNNRIKAIAASGADTNSLRDSFSFNYGEDDSLIKRILTLKEPVHLDRSTEPELFDFLDRPVKALAADTSAFYLCPIIADSEVVSVVYMDAGEKENAIDPEQLQAADQLIKSVAEAMSGFKV